MFVVIPYHVDVPMRTLPWMNWVLIGVTVVFFFLCGDASHFTPLGETLVLGHGPLGWVGHLLVHGDLGHLVGNMLFLWVFGNAVCSKVGNLAYPLVYFGLGTFAGAVFYLLTPHPAVGASGAINGIVGVFVVWYLLNDLSCWYGYWFFSVANAGEFAFSSYWMVLLWLVFDVWGIVRGGGNIGHLAHVAGFAAGFVLGVVLLTTKLVEMDKGERSLLQVFAGEE
jgi:membrane associated rhomboid family serine protease